MWLWRRHQYHRTDEHMLKSVIIKHMRNWLKPGPFSSFMGLGQGYCVHVCDVPLMDIYTPNLRGIVVLWYHLELSSTPTCQLTASTTMTTPTWTVSQAHLTTTPQTKPYILWIHMESFCLLHMFRRYYVKLEMKLWEDSKAFACSVYIHKIVWTVHYVIHETQLTKTIVGENAFW